MPALLHIIVRFRLQRQSELHRVRELDPAQRPPHIEVQPDEEGHQRQADGPQGREAAGEPH